MHCAGSYTLKTQGYTPEVVKQVHVSLNADLNPKAQHPRWEQGAFICVEVPVASVDLDCFAVLPGSEHEGRVAATALDAALCDQP